MTADSTGEEVTVKNNSFRMPGDDVTVTAVFEASTPSYAVINDGVSGGTGSITISPSGAIRTGSSFTVNVSVDSDYRLDSVTVDGSTDASCAGQTSFSQTYTMGDHDVHVSAVCHQYIFHASFSANIRNPSATYGTAGTEITFSLPPLTSGGYAVTVTNTTTSESSHISSSGTDDSGNLIYRFTLPASNVEVSAAEVY